MDAILAWLTRRVSFMEDALIGFCVEVVVAFVIFIHYRFFGSSLSNQQSFGPVLPFVALTTFLVISAIKSSFALSLGLVGALSVVRFRTPVKDPHELAYLYLSIASGVAAAAGELTLTVVIVPLILALMIVLRRRRGSRSENVFVSVDMAGVTDVEAAFATVNSVVRANAAKSGFMRYEMHEGILHLTGEVELAEPQAMPRITNELRKHYPSTNVSFHDESTLPTP
jgi:hypothetical protein